MLNTWIEHFSIKGIGNHAISMTSDEDCIIKFGGFSFKELKEKEIFILDYNFTPDVWGNGFATEFFNGIIDHILSPSNVIDFIARTHPEKNASIRALEITVFVCLEVHDNKDGMGWEYYLAGNCSGHYLQDGIKINIINRTHQVCLNPVISA